MKYKKSLVFICLLICLFSIASVTASDVNETVVAIDNQNEIVNIENNDINEVVSAEVNNQIIESVDDKIDFLSANSEGSFTDLANDISNANGVLNLTKNYVYDSSKDSSYINGITINKKITINGKGFVIKGNDQSRAFNVAASGVILKNIKFNNCYSSSSSGGAVYWNGDNGKILDCNFVYCHSDTYAGAIHWNTAGGTISDCTFDHCYSSGTSAGAVYWKGNNGNLINSVFKNCHVYHNITLTVGSSSSTSCNSYGGAVSWNGNYGNLINSRFEDCYASSMIDNTFSTTTTGTVSTYGNAYGGAIYWSGSNGNLTQSIFKNCYGSGYSYCYSYGSSTSSNTNAYSYCYGGAIDWHGTSGNLIDCDFENCYASTKSYGLSSKRVSTSYSYSYGGTIYWFGDNGNLKNSTFKTSYCTSSSISSVTYGTQSSFSRGGVIYWYGDNGNLFNASLNNFRNTATNDTSGTAIYWFGDEGNMFSCSFNGQYTNYQVCCKAEKNVYPVILIYPSSIDNDDNRIEIFECTPLVKKISVSIYDVSDKITLYKQFVISSDELSSNFTINDLDEGEYQIVMEYAGDIFYSATSSNNLFKVGKNSSFDVTRFGGVVEGDDVVINLTLNETATGKVKIILSNYTFINELVGGKTSFNIPYVNGGVNTYKIKYEGDENYNPLYIEDSFIVLNKSIISIDLKENNLFDENILLNYTITPNCSGIISIFVDDVFKTNISVGDTFELENIAVGNHNVTVIYNGDEYFSTSKDTATFTVSKADPSIMINSTNLAGDVVFEVNLTEMATGNVTISLNNNLYSERIKNGKAVIVIPNLGAGDHDCVISYEGDSNYNPSTQNYNFKLQFKKSNITINVGDITLGDVLDVKFNLTEGTTGTIGVYINDNLVQTIEVNDEISIPDLTVGNYSVKLVYNGDEFYETSQDISTFYVLKIKPTIEIISVTSNSADITFGDIVIVNYQITNGVTGTIGVYIDSILNKTVNVGDSLSVGDLNAGVHTIKLVYNGDENYRTSENNVTFEVLKQEIDISNAATIVDAVYGKTKIVFNSPIDGNLNIILSNGYQKSFNILSNENNNLDLSDANAGDYEITYNFVPTNKNYQDATYSDSLKILKTLPKFNIDVKDINYNQNFKAEITFLSDITGTMNITLKNEDDDEIDKKINLNMVNGILKYEINKLDASRYYLTFSYSGNDNYYTYNEEASFQVFKIDPIMYFDITNATYGQTARIVVNSAVEGNITFKIGSISYDEVLIENNLIIQDIKNIDAGNYTVKIIYNGNNNYNAKTYDAKLTINKLPTTVIGTADDITYSESAIINVKASMDGNVIVAIDESYIDNINVLSNTVTPITFANIPAGKHNVSITFKPTNKNYDESSFNTDFTVSKKQTSVSLDVVDSVYGEDVVVCVTASEDGSVVLTVGDITRERTVLANTMVKFNLGVLAADSYDVSVSLDAGSNYKTSNKEDSFVVSPAVAEIVSVQAQDNVYEENIVVKVKTNVDGILTVNVNDVDKEFSVTANKLTSCDLGILDVGTYTVTVSLDAGSNYTKSINTTKVTVSPKSTTVNIDVVDSVYGEDVVVCVTASEDGSVVLTVGDISRETTVLANTVTEFNLGVLAAGSYDVSVSLDAGSNYKTSNKDDSFVVSPAKAEIISIQVPDNVYGQHSVIKVKTNVDGFVYVVKDVTTYRFEVTANKVTSYDMGVQSVRTYSLTVSLDAGNNYTKPVNTTEFTVSPKSTSVDVDVDDYVYGEDVIVNVTASENGKVTIKMGDINKTVDVNANKVVSVNLGKFDVGSYDINVAFDAGKNYVSSFKTKSIDISKANAMITTVQAVNSSYGVNTVVKVRANVGGVLTVKVGEITKSSNIEAGNLVSFDFGVLDAGTYHVLIDLDAGENYIPAHEEKSINISPKSTSVSLSVKDSVYGEDVVVCVTASEDGSVVLTVGDISRETRVLTNTVTEFNLGVLAAGSYDVSVSFNAGSNYKTSNKEDSFVVSPAVAEIVSVQAQNNVYGENTIVNVTTNVDGVLTVNVKDVDIEFEVTANNLTSCDLGILDVGNYTLTISLNSGSNFTQPTDTTNVIITTKSTSVNLNVEDSVYGENVVVCVTASEDGSVVLTVGDISRETRVLANTVTEFNLGVLAAGSYDVSVSFNGGSNYKASNKEDSFVVSPAVAEIVSVQAQDNVYEENVIVKVKTNVDGILTVKVGEETKSINIKADNLTSLDFGVLNVGNYTVTVSLDAGSNYTKPTNTTKITIAPKSTIVDIGIENSVYGNDVVVNVTASENGKVTIKMADINKTVNVNANNVVSVNLGRLNVGSYGINVTFDAGDNYVSSFKTGLIVISKANAIITDVQVDNSAYEENVIVNVKTNVDGVLTVKVGEETKSINIKADNLTSLDFGVLNVGNYTVTVSLDAGNNYVQSSKVESFKIVPKQTEVILTVKEYDVTENVIVNVTANENGKIIINLGSFNKTLNVTANHVTSIDFGNLSIGSYDVIVNFTAGNNYIGSSAYANIKVSSKINDNEINISIPEIKSDSENSITVNLPSDATGSVTLTINNTDYSFPVENGVAIVKTPVLDSGYYDYKISYSGDNKYASFSKSGNLTVKTKTNETSIPSISDVKVNDKINITLPGDAEGTVTLTINGIDYSFDVVNGVANVVIPDLDSGNYQYTITYSGDGKYSSLVKQGHVNVAPKPATVVAKNMTVTYGSGYDFIASFFNVDGSPLANSPVIFTVNGNDNLVNTDSNGIAILNIGLGNGVYNIISMNYVTGESVNNVLTIVGEPAPIKDTIISAKSVITAYNGGNYLIITLKDTSGNLIKNKLVSINLNGKVSRQITNLNGQIKVSTNGLAPKSYTATITFDGDDNYAKSSTIAKVTVKKATPKITAKAKKFKKSVKTKKYSITLKDNTGKVIKKATVTLKIKNKTYKAKTNSKGKATFKIKKLTKKGTFKSVVTYKGNAYYTGVTKKVKIKIK